MKKVFYLVILALVAVTAGQIGSPEQGKRMVARQWIYFDPGSSDGDSTQKLLARNDTLWADSAGTLKKINGTADSCSYPFFIGDKIGPRPNDPTVYAGGTYPGVYTYLSVLIKSDRTDSNRIKFHVDTRDQYEKQTSANQFKTAYTEWTMRGKEKGGGYITIVDTVHTDSTQTAAKQRQKLHINVHGTQARICPEMTAAFADHAADSTWLDSLYYIAQ